VPCIPTLVGVKAAPEVSRMTLRELLQKVSPDAQKPSLVSKIRQILAATEAFPEHQVYEVMEKSKWAKIITQDLCISLNDMKAVAVTGYGTNGQFFETLKTALDAAGYAAHAIYSDEQGWRTIYACATGDDDPDAFLLCANWYAESREVVKKAFGSSENSENTHTNTSEATTTDAEDIDIELGDEDIGDPFA